MNVNLYDIEDYENKTTLRPQKNKPNSNPICILSSLVSLCPRKRVACPGSHLGEPSNPGRAAQQINKFYLTPKVAKSIITGEICDSIQYIMSDI